MLLLGISFQLLTLFCAGIIFIDPLKKLGRHLKHLDDDSFDRSIDLKSDVYKRQPNAPYLPRWERRTP